MRALTDKKAVIYGRDVARAFAIFSANERERERESFCHELFIKKRFGKISYGTLSNAIVTYWIPILALVDAGDYNGELYG